MNNDDVMLKEYEDYDCYKIIIDDLKPFIEEYKNTKQLEIEFRIGYYDDILKKFNSDVSEIFFKNIKNIFDNSSVMKKTNIVSEDVYDINKIRKTTITTMNDKSTLIKKTKLVTLDYRFEGRPFDIRVSISKETHVKKFDEECYRRRKNRFSYIYKYWSFDLTEVLYNSIDNPIEDKKYEIEIELYNTINTIIKENKTIEYFLYSTLLKIKDIMDMCENESSHVKITKINKY